MSTTFTVTLGRDWPVTPALIESKHALVRRQQRGIPTRVRDTLVLYGSEHPARDGAVALAMSRGDIRTALADDPSLRGIEGLLRRCRAVLSANGVLITMTLNRRGSRSVPRRSAGDATLAATG